MYTNINNISPDGSDNHMTIQISAGDFADVIPSPPCDTDEKTRPLTAPVMGQGFIATNSTPGADSEHTVLIKGVTPQAVDGPLAPEQWVQGWLVAISGPMKGKSFPICFGNNQVGRSQECRICLPDDPSISAKQAVIRFKEKTRTYKVKSHDDSKQNTFLNGSEELDESEIIELGDTLKLSDQTTLRFVPFCDEEFVWDYSAPAPEPPPAANSMYQPVGETVRFDAAAGRFHTQPIPLNNVTRPIDLMTQPITQPIGHAMGQAMVDNSESTQLFTPGTSIPTTPVPSTDPYRTTPIDLLNPYSSSSELKPEEWVQGWLVAISGPMKGKFYPIVYGRNQVGRSPECRICLPHDPAISGKQLVIRFKEKKRTYTVKDHDDAKQITIMNDDEELDDVVDIQRGDTLRLSPQTTMRFIPFCDDTFTWDYPSM